MDKNDVLKLLTGLGDTEPIAEVHFDMDELKERAEAIAQAHEDDKWDAIRALDEAWHEIVDKHLLEIAALKSEVGKVQDLVAAVYGVLRKAREEE